jgi:hypothetical protein
MCEVKCSALSLAAGFRFPNLRRCRDTAHLDTATYLENPNLDRQKDRQFSAGSQIAERMDARIYIALTTHFA